MPIIPRRVRLRDRKTIEPPESVNFTAFLMMFQNTC